MTDSEFAVAWADRSRLLRHIAAELGVHPPAVTKRAQRLGLPSRGQGALPRVSAAEIEAAYLDADTPLRVYAKRWKITPSSITQRARKFGLLSRRAVGA